MKTSPPAYLALTTGFGLGRLPGAPGTWGSLLPATAAAGAFFFAANIDLLRTGLVLCAIVFSAATVLWGREAQAFHGAEDPPAVVSDEIAGQSVALLAAGDILSALLAFGAFRLFDILKPWPIRRLERLPAGYGILADDLGAGTIALVCVALARRFAL